MKTAGMAPEIPRPLQRVPGIVNFITTEATFAMKIMHILATFLIASAGGLLFHLLRTPLPWMLGPLAATMIYHAASAKRARWPVELRNLGMIVIGTYFGVIITLESLKRLGKVFPYAIGAAAALLAFTYFLGFGLTLLTPATPLTGFLRTAPGGLSEVGVGGLALNADVAFIMAYQMFRLFFILLLIPP